MKANDKAINLNHAKNLARFVASVWATSSGHQPRLDRTKERHQSAELWLWQGSVRAGIAGQPTKYGIDAAHIL